MASTQARPAPTQQVVLEPFQLTCRACGNRMRMGHHSHRTVTTLRGVTQLTRDPSIDAAIKSVRATTSQHVQKRRGTGRCLMGSLAWM